MHTNAGRYNSGQPMTTPFDEIARKNAETIQTTAHSNIIINSFPRQDKNYVNISNSLHCTYIHSVFRLKTRIIKFISMLFPSR